MNSNEVVIIDTCAYLRLAKYLHPLLKRQFKNGFKIYIHQDFQDEYDNKRFEDSDFNEKFGWVNSLDYRENRVDAAFQLFDRKDKEKFQMVYESFCFEADSKGLSVSRVDIKCLVFAYMRQIPALTDDFDMQMLAKEFEITTYDSLDVLKLLLESGDIGIGLVKNIVDSWKSINDMPGRFYSKYNELF